jgi:hypothetical protein
MKKLDGHRLLWGWGLLISLFLLVMNAVLVATAVAQEPAPQENAKCGILAYEWKGEVTTADRGFPREQPPRNNYDWKKPVNYANGTLHLRVEIFDQPVVQENMHLQLCFWQPKANKPSDRFALETCSKMQNVVGKPGTVVTWSQDIEAMWKLNGTPLDWNRLRYRSAVAIKNKQKANRSPVPVSDYNGWKWNGEKPGEWYPLVMNFTGRVTPPGTEFAGWDTCLDGSATAVSIQSIGAHRQGDRFYTPIILVALFASLVVLTASAILLRREE